MVAQLRSEGAVSRVLAGRPEAALGQMARRALSSLWYSGRRGAFESGGFAGPGVFLVGREVAGSDRGAAALRECEPFDLCIIDEAHEVFANIYRRFENTGTIALIRTRRVSPIEFEVSCEAVRCCC